MQKNKKNSRIFRGVMVKSTGNPGGQKTSETKNPISSTRWGIQFFFGKVRTK